MGLSRRDFIKSVGAGMIATGLTGRTALGFNSKRSESLLIKSPEHPVAADFDRLPLSWYKNTVKRLKEKLKTQGVEAVLLRDRWNIIYFTGLFHTTTERPFFVLLPVNENAIFWFHPGLDRDLVTSWWSTDNDYYFDYLHAEGGYPNKGKVLQGKTVDILEWAMKGIKRRGYGEKLIGVDWEFTPSQMKKIKNILPQAKFKNISQICLKMRMVKTKEEIALTQRAMNYFSKIHAFARDYILEHGTDATDFEVAQAATKYGINLIMKDIKHDGKPHSGVGISVRIGCRTGIATAYPHPNQFFYKKIEKGDALQVAGGVRIGGYGGELYRYFQIAPWNAYREKVWEVVTECVHIQARESRAGVTCSSIAKKIHDYQVKNGLAKLIYHRPAHGMGMEGHQAPWLALGDYTVLEEGMMFSVEPGLYDPENGFGYNPSDTLLVTKDKGILMGSVPYSKEWSFLKL
ncbi:MAG: M24 family metallopeptidase [Candidatus Aminicenantia bacterium]